MEWKKIKVYVRYVVVHFVCVTTGPDQIMGTLSVFPDCEISHKINYNIFRNQLVFTINVLIPMHKTITLVLVKKRNPIEV